MKNKAAVTLVRNGDVLYPFQERDYEGLRTLGVPLTNLTIDYLPLLRALARKNGVDVQLIPFEPIEHEMFSTKVTPRWSHDLGVTKDAVTLTYPKTQSETSVEKLVEALKRWYRKHYVTFDISIKRTAKKVVITMRKTYGQPK